MKRMPGILSRVLLIAVVLMAFTAFTPVESVAFLSDSAAHPPPSSGYYIYSPHGSPLTYTFSPENGVFPAKNGSYTDPVFGETVKRLTDVYSGNMEEVPYHHTRISADSTYYLITDLNGWSSVRYMSNTNTFRSNKNWGVDVQFAVSDDDVVYYRSGNGIAKYVISTDSTTSNYVNWGTGASSFGGTGNFVSRDDKYFAGLANSQIRFTDIDEGGQYSNRPTGVGIGGGYVLIAPDGSGVLYSNRNKNYWVSVNHSTNAFGTPIEVTNSMPHADLVTASNGKTYFIVPEPNMTTIFGNSLSGPQQAQDLIWKINVTDQTYSILFDRNHVQSCVGMGRARSPNQDWFVVLGYSNEGSLPASPWSSWAPFKAEVFLVNVLDASVKRLAHDRSRVLNWDYTAQPHGGISPDGQYVIFDSNMGRYSGAYKDTYYVTTGLSGPVATPPVAPTGLKIVP